LNRGTGVNDFGNRVSLSYINQFFDHTLGLAIGAAREDAPIQQKQYQAWWWSVDNGSAGIDQNWGGPHTPGLPDNVISQEGMQLRALSQDQVRDGVMGVLEWAPNDSYYSTLNLFYSKFAKRSYKNGLQWSSSPYDHVSYSNVGTTDYAPYPLVTSGTLADIAPILQNGYNKERDYLFSADWNNQVHLGDAWTLTGDLAYSSARVSLLDAYAFTGLPGGALTSTQFSTPRDFGFPDFNPAVDFGNPANLVFTDPDNYSYNGRQEFDHQKDRIKSARFAISHPLGWIFDSVDVGFNYSDREKTKRADVFFAYLNGNGSDVGTYDPHFGAPIDPSVLRGSTSLGYGGVGPIVGYNVLDALARQFYLTQRNGAGDYNRNYSVREKVPVGYLKFNIDTMLGSVRLRGNAGVQVVHTNQSSQALQTTGNEVAGTLTGGASYTNVLPSLNLVAEVGDKQYVRFGFAKTLTRGRIDDEKVASSASVSQVMNGPGAGQVRWSGSGGNPKLRPYIAVGTDLTWEKYFDNATYLSAGVFNKNILNYIYTQTVADYDFSGYTNNNPLLTPTSNIGTFSTPENGTGGRMQGLELAGALAGGRISPALAGFGIQANFSLINSTIPKSTISSIPGGPKSLPGLSRKTANLQLYYELHGFSLRVAERYRSSFTGEAVALFDQIGYTKVLANKETDLQAGYEFSTGRLKGLSLLLQVTNLTNEPFKSEQVSGLPNNVTVARPLEYDTWGRTVLFGVNYAM
jgi:TonB-dependent receptor